MKIVFLDTDTLGEVENLKEFETFGELTFYGFTSPEETLERIEAANVVFTNKVVISSEIMDACQHLKYIGILATGTNNVDLTHAADKGITVKNVAGYSTESVAQHTFSMILNLVHSSTYYTDFVKNDYALSPIFTNLSRPYFELKGRMIGIIGLGNIGRRVAKLAEAFDMQVQYYSTSGKNTSSDYTQVSLDELLSTSDIVSIHAPLNDNTKNLIGKDQFSKMKSSAYLLNNGRGGIVDEQALALALNFDLIAGAGIDVFEQEPIDKSNPLIDCQNVILSPHIAWASIEARHELVRLSIQNLKAFLEA